MNEWQIEKLSGVTRDRHKLNFVPTSSWFFSDPDRIVRIDSSERVELNGRRIEERGGRMSNKRKSKKHASTPRRREVLLSKISIYIVYMFVSCHRYVNLETKENLLEKRSKVNFGKKKKIIHFNGGKITKNLDFHVKFQNFSLKNST